LPTLGTFELGWSVFLPQGEFGSSDWRHWVAEKQPLNGRKRGRGVPGATVVVVDSFLEIHRERVMELNAAAAPMAARAFRVGEGSSITRQMLSEFMGMYGSNFRPPSLPSVWYNGLVPYWVQQGWSSPSGPTVTVGVEARPSGAQPGRR